MKLGPLALPDLGSTSDVPAALPTGPTSPREGRDAALDELVTAGLPPCVADTDPAADDLAAVDQAIADGRAVVAERRFCLTCDGSGWVLDPTADLLGARPCPGCGGRRS